MLPWKEFLRPGHDAFRVGKALEDGITAMLDN